MGFYERQFGETTNHFQETDKPRRSAIAGNYFDLFMDNFKFILFFVPTFVCLSLGMIAESFFIMLLGILLLIPAGPAVAAAYDVGYQIAQGKQKFERRSFFQSYRANFRQGLATMVVQVPFFAVILVSLLTKIHRPFWVAACLVLGCYLLMSFSMFSFSQIALVDLTAVQIWKNSVLLLFSFGWRGILVTGIQMAAIWVIYRWLAYVFPLVLFLFPALLIAWSSVFLFPRLKAVLLNDNSTADGA